jgi:hypothetical protein
MGPGVKSGAQDRFRRLQGQPHVWNKRFREADEFWRKARRTSLYLECLTGARSTLVRIHGADIWHPGPTHGELPYHMGLGSGGESTWKSGTVRAAAGSGRPRGDRLWSPRW